MPAKIALLVGFAFIVWLFRRDMRKREGISGALWIPLLWLFVISSKPVCLWLGFGGGSGDAYEEGTPLDRLFYLALILMGLRVLAQRGVRLSQLAAANKWLFIFILYWGASILWSDYTVVAGKRWIKECGNIVMALVVLTEIDPVQAARALFVRCGYILIPLSVIFIKYLPDVGRVYNRWTWQYMYVGVAQHKNSLGAIVLVCGLFMAWEFFFSSRAKGPRLDWKERAARWLLLAMSAWLLHKAGSATSLVCTALGLVILTGFRLPLFRRNAAAFAGYVLAVSVFFVVLDSVFGLREVLVASVGRDTTLTTRTGLWSLVLQQDFNPLFGTGFYTFWMGNRLEAIWKVYEGVNQAHNGYLETYLNGGLIGFFLLIIWLCASYTGLRKRLLQGKEFAQIQFAVWAAVIVYNFTEATFDRLSPLWIAMLVSTISAPMRRVGRAAAAEAVGRSDFTRRMADRPQAVSV